MILNTQVDAKVAADRISRDDVIWTYRVMLGRDPESDAAIANALSHETMQQLVQDLVESVEFRTKHNVESSRVPLESPKLDVEWRTDPATMKRLIDHVSTTWQKLGEERPHWSVLAWDEFLPEHFHDSEERFLATGKLDVDRLLATIKRLDRSPDDFKTVFEFGCGVGRVTVHLASRFQAVTACDVSGPHLDLARCAAPREVLANVKFVRAAMPEFGMLEPFDLWFSRIVLQHNSPPVIALILDRALTMLNRGGLAVFQVPTYSPVYHFRVSEYLSNLANSEMEMHVLPQPVVFQIASAAGCIPLEVLEDDATGSPLLHSTTFVFTKPRATRSPSPPKSLSILSKWLVGRRLSHSRHQPVLQSNDSNHGPGERL